MSDFNLITCPDCGIEFSFAKKVEALWRDSHKSFFCPNGHSLSWRDETSQEKEIKALSSKVAELKEQLAASQVEVEALKKRNAELEAELEIWGPDKVGENKDEST